MQNKNVGELLNFIEASKAKGASDEFLASFLMRRGWPQDDVYAALGAYWERATGLAIPRSYGGRRIVPRRISLPAVIFDVSHLEQRTRFHAVPIH